VVIMTICCVLLWLGSPWSKNYVVTKCGVDVMSNLKYLNVEELRIALEAEENWIKQLKNRIRRDLSKLSGAEERLKWINKYIEEKENGN